MADAAAAGEFRAGRRCGLRGTARRVIAGQPAPPAVWIAELTAGLTLAAFVAAGFSWHIAARPVRYT